MPTFIPGLSDFFSTKTYQQIMESYNLIGTQLYPFIPGGETPSFHHVILHILQSFSKKSRLHYEYLSRHPKKTRMLIKQKEQKRTLNVSEEGWASMKDRTHVETFFFQQIHTKGLHQLFPQANGWIPISAISSWGWTPVLPVILGPVSFWIHLCWISFLNVKDGLKCGMNGLVTEVGEIILRIWDLNGGWNLQVLWSNLLTCKNTIIIVFFVVSQSGRFHTKCFRKSKAQFSNIKVREMISLTTCPMMPGPNTPDSGRLDDTTTLSNNNVVWKSKELLGLIP